MVDLYGDQTIAYGDENRMCPVIGIQLAEYSTDVILDRLLADAQQVGYTLIRIALGDMVQDLDFLGG